MSPALARFAASTAYDPAHRVKSLTDLRNLDSAVFTHCLTYSYSPVLFVMADYGADAKSYVPQLQALMSVTQDEERQKLLQGAIDLIQKGPDADAVKK